MYGQFVLRNGIICVVRKSQMKEGYNYMLKWRRIKGTGARSLPGAFVMFDKYWAVKLFLARSKRGLV